MDNHSVGSVHSAVPIDRVESLLSYGAYLDGLLDEMARRPSLLYLAQYLRNYGRESLFPNYTPRDAEPPDVKAIHGRDCDWTWHQRQWDYRERAREIIEGSEPWPHRLLPWKEWHELRYYQGYAEHAPAWLDPANNPAPYDPKPRRKRARKPLTGLKAKVAAKRRARRNGNAAR